MVEEMQLAARYAVAQGWQEPETREREMDSVLAEAISRPVGRALSAWWETAAQHHRNEQYYRGLLVKIGEMIGAEAYVSDDGSVHDDVLVAKIPELVSKLIASR